MPGTEQETKVKVVKLETEIHNIHATLNKLFEKFDSFVAKSQPKPLSVYMVLASTVAMLSIFALLFGSVIYIANSAIAPLAINIQQLNSNQVKINSGVSDNHNLIQLTNKEISGIEKQTRNNDETLEWLIFTENIPKQLTVLKSQVMHLEEKVNELRSK